MRSRPRLFGKTSVLLSFLCLAGAASAQVPSARRTPAPPAALEQQATPPVAEPPATAAVPVSPAAADEAPARRAGEEEIVVTGSRVRRKDLTTPAPVTVLTREQLQASGKVTIGDCLQMMPEQGNAPNFQLNNGGATYSADGATRINLRNLGVTRTLVLVNGRRFVPGGVGASSSVDLNTIPAAAVERIEVLKDGGSAIYGSDAISGVVNVITRKTFNGTEASAMYGLSGKGDAGTFDGQVTTGRSGDAGNFLFSVGYFNQQDSWLRDRTWSQDALTYDYAHRVAIPGGSARTPQGTVGLPQNKDGSATPECMANPVCSSLVGLDPTNFGSDAFIRVLSSPATSPAGWKIMGDADTFNFARENYLTIPSTRIQAYSAGDTRYRLVRGYYELSYVQRNSQQNAAPMPLNPGDYNMVLSKDNLYNPLGVDLPFVGRRLVEFGRREYKQDLATFRVVGGVDGTLPEDLGPLRGWYWDASVNYGRTTGTLFTSGALRNSRVADAVGPSMLVNGVPRCVRTAGDPNTVIAGCVPINLLHVDVPGVAGSGIDPAQIGGLGFDGTSRAFDGLFAVDLNTTGELFRLTADRPLSLALGYEFRRQSGSQIADPIAAAGDSADFNFQSTSGQFNVHEGYGELSIPLVSNMPGVQDLEASVAGRWVNYSTFGSKFTYKFGARYTPVRDFTLRGTFSTAFRSPTISELYLGQSETAPIATDPCNFGAGTDPVLRAQCVTTGVPAGGSGDTGNQELAHVGGNGALKPETAQVFTAGVVVQPRMVRDLSITLDYYNVFVDNLIGTVGVAAILAGCYPGSSGTPFQPYCDRITRSSAGRILFVTDLNENVGQLRTDGIDLAVRYSIPSTVGRFALLFDGTWLHKFDRTLVLATGNQTVHAKGNYDLGGQAYGGPLPEYKFNAGVNWGLGGLSAGALLRYVGTFDECSTPPPDLTSAGGLCNTDNPGVLRRQVGHNTTVDLNASYVL
ncbi:MAG: TonB-dependent receptor plug domain-containing protein, partial [Myxococcales bacterium]